MNCTRTHQVVDAYVDGELDPATRLELTEHLAACPACARLHAQRDALAQRVRTIVPRYLAPAALLRRVHRLQGAQPPRDHGWTFGPTWMQAAVIVVVVAIASALLGYHVGHPPSDDPIREHLVTSHVASLGESGRLVGIASSDRHVIKPWLSGRVDFAPAVRDFSDHGYTLVGARLDQVHGERAVAIVYRVRNHTINLYAWRASHVAVEAPATTISRGFSLVTWAEGGLRYAAIADIEGRELGEFALLVRTPNR